jgi:hypothetical protein
MRVLSYALAATTLLATVAAERFVRFISTDGLEHYGDAILPSNTTDARFAKTAKLIEGDILGNFTVTNQVLVRTSSQNEGCYSHFCPEHRFFTFPPPE